jgi:hypothetical protein
MKTKSQLLKRADELKLKTYPSCQRKFYYQMQRQRARRSAKYKFWAGVVAVTPSIITGLVVQMFEATGLVMATTVVVILAMEIYKRGEQLEK